MATKVGAFKKDGTVQCVKLVEELGTSKLSGFNGVWDSSSKKVIFDNGYTMQVSIAGSQDGQYTSVILSYYPESIQFMNGDNVIMKLHIDRDNSVFTNEAAYLWPTTQDYVVTSLMFNYAAGMFIYYLQCVLTAPSGESFTWRSSYTTKVNIELDQSEGSYLLRYTDRFSPPTVRMGKDGTLHCSKLIEEPIINLIDDYSGTSASPYDKLVLNNGITLTVTKDGAPAENFFRTLVLQFSSAASTTSLLFAISIMGSNIDFYDGSVPWEFKQDYPIDGYITVSTPNVYAAGQYVLTISDSTQSVNYSVTLDSSSTAFSFSPSTSGDYFILSYDMRMKVPTVRIGKDGTIRCAKVQEATLTPKIGNGDWFEMTRSSASSGTFNFYGGQWTMTVEGPNGGSPTLFQTVSTIYAQVPLLPSGQPDNTIQWVGPPPYTTYYPSIYDESNYNRDGTININRIVVISSASMEGYKITINNGQNTAVYEWHLFTGTSNAFEPVGEQQWELTESDRFTYSWD